MRLRYDAGADPGRGRPRHWRKPWAEAAPAVRRWCPCTSGFGQRPKRRLEGSCAAYATSGHSRQMAAKRRSRSSLTRRAAARSLSACASAPRVSKSTPGLRKRCASGMDLSFSKGRQVGVAVDLADFAVVADDLGGEQAGMVVVQVGRQRAAGELVDERRGSGPGCRRGRDGGARRCRSCSRPRRCRWSSARARELRAQLVE